MAENGGVEFDLAQSLADLLDSADTVVAVDRVQTPNMDAGFKL